MDLCPVVHTVVNTRRLASQGAFYAVAQNMQSHSSSLVSVWMSAHRNMYSLELELQGRRMDPGCLEALCLSC